MAITLISAFNPAVISSTRWRSGWAALRKDGGDWVAKRVTGDWAPPLERTTTLRVRLWSAVGRGVENIGYGVLFKNLIMKDIIKLVEAY